MSEILDEDMEQAELDVYINGIKDNCLLGLSQPWDNAEFLSLRQGFSAFAKVSLATNCMDRVLTFRCFDRFSMETTSSLS